MPNSCYIGIDIGGTNTVFGVMNTAGTLLALDRLPTQAENPFEQLLDRLQPRLERMIAEHCSAFQLVSIGVGAPNANALTGWMESPPNLSWGRCDLVNAVRSRFHVPVALTNDANAAALGEAIFGAGRGLQHLVVLTLGTGLGAGFIVDGQLHHGFTGFAGELGHVLSDGNDRLCTCGLRGCLETWVSAQGISRTAFEMIGENRLLKNPVETSLDPRSDLSPKALFEAAEAGDSLAAKCFSETGTRLGKALATVVALSSPEAIIFCGGISRAGDWLLEPVRRALEAHSLSVFKNTVSIIPSGLPEDHAGVLGAAQWGRVRSR